MFDSDLLWWSAKVVAGLFAWRLFWRLRLGSALVRLVRRG